MTRLELARHGVKARLLDRFVFICIVRVFLRAAIDRPRHCAVLGGECR